MLDPRHSTLRFQQTRGYPQTAIKCSLVFAFLRHPSVPLLPSYSNLKLVVLGHLSLAHVYQVRGQRHPYKQPYLLLLSHSALPFPSNNNSLLSDRSAPPVPSTCQVGPLPTSWILVYSCRVWSVGIGWDGSRTTPQGSPRGETLLAHVMETGQTSCSDGFTGIMLGRDGEGIYGRMYIKGC